MSAAAAEDRFSIDAQPAQAFAHVRENLRVQLVEDPFGFGPSTAAAASPEAACAVGGTEAPVTRQPSNAPSEDLSPCSRNSKFRLKRGSEKVKTQNKPLPETFDANALRNFLSEREGSALRAWLKYFDSNNDQAVTWPEFQRGIQALGYQGDAKAIFHQLDADDSGILSLQEIDGASAQMWSQFRAWCASTFTGAEDMRRRLMKMAGKDPEGQLSEELFIKGLHAMGCHLAHLGFETVLFASLDSSGLGFLRNGDLGWIDSERRRLKQKEEAKMMVQADGAKRGRLRKEGAVQLKAFKEHLCRRCGGYIRAWRTVLSPSVETCMVLQKQQFMKACAKIGWFRNVSLLWIALDRDGSGNITMDDLDVKSAMAMAQLQKFVESLGGSAAQAFRTLDITGTGRIRQSDFAQALSGRGFKGRPKLLFKGLAKDGSSGCLVEQDLLFLDKWKPPMFLLARANEEAKEDLKAKLVRKYGSYLKAWRKAFDKEKVNRCCWTDFQDGCKMVRYTGDAAGAWRALDADFSGFIGLEEFDLETSKVLLSFKMFAHEEFGSVRSLFGVFDHDGSGELSNREFTRSCRAYGFIGDARVLFRAFDTDGGRKLSMEEMAFLDDWLVEDPSLALAEAEDPASSRSPSPGCTANLGSPIARTARRPVPKHPAQRERRRRASASPSPPPGGAAEARHRSPSSKRLLAAPRGPRPQPELLESMRHAMAEQGGGCSQGLTPWEVAGQDVSRRAAAAAGAALPALGRGPRGACDIWMPARSRSTSPGPQGLVIVAPLQVEEDSRSRGCASKLVGGYGRKSPTLDTLLGGLLPPVCSSQKAPHKLRSARRRPQRGLAGEGQELYSRTSSGLEHAEGIEAFVLDSARGPRALDSARGPHGIG